MFAHVQCLILWHVDHNILFSNLILSSETRVPTVKYAFFTQQSAKNMIQIWNDEESLETKVVKLSNWPQG